jgi:predicted SnoaL-like aldol condensation-catalyzing enzyme
VSDPEAHRALVLAFCRAFYDEKDYPRASAMLAPDFVNHHPGAGVGPAATVRSFRAAVGDRFPGFTLDIRQTVTEGDRVWTHSLVRLEPDGAATAEVVDMWRIADGLIAEHRDVGSALG